MITNTVRECGGDECEGESSTSTYFSQVIEIFRAVD